MPQEPEKFGMRESMNLSYVLASTHALCITPFLRTGFGMEAFGLPAIFACGLMLLCALGSPDMFGYFVAWIVAVAIQRARSFKADRQGDVVHSRYRGWPVLAMRVPWVRSEPTAKLVVEPLICLTTSVAVTPLSPAIGSFVLWGCFSLLFTAGVNRQLRLARVRRMRDAQLEQEQLVRDFKRTSRSF
jgi:hypothetical protein